jgi:hypothetical protein
MKECLRFIYAIVIGLGLSILLTSSAFSQISSQDNQAPQLNDGVIQIISPEGYIPPDYSWPIVRREFYNYLDPKSGEYVEVETIRRSENPQYSDLHAEGINCN